MENEAKLTAGAMVTFAIAVSALVILPYVQVRDEGARRAQAYTAPSCAGAPATSPMAASPQPAAALRKLCPDAKRGWGRASVPGDYYYDSPPAGQHAHRARSDEHRRASAQQGLASLGHLPSRAPMCQAPSCRPTPICSTSGQGGAGRGGHQAAARLHPARQGGRAHARGAGSGALPAGAQARLPLSPRAARATGATEPRPSRRPRPTPACMKDSTMKDPVTRAQQRENEDPRKPSAPCPAALLVAAGMVVGGGLHPPPSRSPCRSLATSAPRRPVRPVRSWRPPWTARRCMRRNAPATRPPARACRACSRRSMARNGCRRAARAGQHPAARHHRRDHRQGQQIPGRHAGLSPAERRRAGRHRQLHPRQRWSNKAEPCRPSCFAKERADGNDHAVRGRSRAQGLVAISDAAAHRPGQLPAAAGWLGGGQLADLRLQA